MRIVPQETRLEPLDAVQQHPQNVNEADVGAIHESVEVNGFYGSIVVQRSTGYILAGNHRWLAAAHAGATEIPVTWVDVDDATALRILLADNRTTRKGQDNKAELADLLQSILNDEGSLEGSGYDADDLDDLLKDLDPEPPAEPGLRCCPECGHEW